jgi:hypothetical protein
LNAIPDAGAGVVPVIVVWIVAEVKIEREPDPKRGVELDFELEPKILVVVEPEPKAGVDPEPKAEAEPETGPDPKPGLEPNTDPKENEGVEVTPKIGAALGDKGVSLNADVEACSDCAD